MSLRTAQAMRDYQDADCKAYQARTNPKVSAEEYKALVHEVQLRKSIFENLRKHEPLTAADKLPKRTESVTQQRTRRAGEALVAARQRKLRAHRESLAARTGNSIYLNPRYETSSR